MQLYRLNLVSLIVLLLLITFTVNEVFAEGGVLDPSVSSTSFSAPAIMPGQVKGGGGFSGTSADKTAISAKSVPGKPGSGPFSVSEEMLLEAEEDIVTDSVRTETKNHATKTVKSEPVLSDIERTMTELPSGHDRVSSQEFDISGLIQFGYSFFKPEARGFSPLTDIPVGHDYLLGAGDRLVITIWGGINANFELEVNRSGEVILPKVGNVKVSGVPFGQLHSLLTGQMARVYKDFNISVTMGKLRIIKVYVVGEVKTPGDYSLSSLSTLINALAAAGGPTKNGTLRTISIKRNGRTVETVDLYGFFDKGDKSVDVRLQAGDTIFVPTIGPVAGITGNVRRPAIYELKNEKSLQELINLAGGVNAAGYLQRLQISRVESHDKKVVKDIYIDSKSSGKTFVEAAAAIPVQDMDLVKIFPIDGKLRDYVRVEGHVLRPGDYDIKPGMRLADLLKEADLLPEYYADSGQITRINPPYKHYEIVSFNIDRALAGSPADNIELQEFDTVKVFAREEMEESPEVRISGAVQMPGVYRLYKNMTVRDLVIQAGNLKRTAFMKSAEVTRIGQNGGVLSTASFNINLEEALKGNPKDNLPLEPFDMVMIRTIPNWTETTDSYITLKGEFVFPGVYPLYKGERIADVIKRAGGFTDKAFLPSAKFSRQYLVELQQARSDEILAREEVNLARKQGELAAIAASKEELEATKAALEGLQKTVAMLKTKKAEGRMVIRLLPVEQLQGSDYNFELTGGDTLEVGIDPRVVSVFGQVYNPASFLHVKNESVGGYLAKSGGFTRDAEEKDVYVIRADGTVTSRQMVPFFSSFLNMEVASGDTIVVPQKIEKVAWMREIKDIAMILGQLAITAGVVVAAGL